MLCSASRNVTAVYPISYGALAGYDSTQLTQYETPTTTVARAYTVQLDGTRRKFYLRVPKQGVAQVKSVVMGSGSEASPVSGGIVAELSDENYNETIKKTAEEAEMSEREVIKQMLYGQSKPITT